MNMYYFGDSLEYIQAEYATSNRSTCRGCKQKIDKDTLRMGLILDDDHFNAKYWYHLKCFQLKPRHREIQEDAIEQKIYNIDHLEEADFDAVIQHIKQELERLKTGKKGSKKDSKKQTKKDTKKKGKGKKKNESQSQSQSSFSQESDSQSEPSESEGQKKKKKKNPKKQSKKVGKPGSGYTPAQQEQFLKLCEKYEEKTIDELKGILSKNRQSKNGVKSQLVEKCADGKLLGLIPICSGCGGGRLRFDRNTGIYTCPGYMEDTTFIRCSKKFEFSQIKREQWIEQ